ncbi:MAG: DinB family protein [Ignavibacteriaceae bacterium]
MYNKISDFQKDWSYESQATLKILNNLTDESLKQKVYEEGRTLGTLAWHLVSALGVMPGQAGLIPLTTPDTKVPSSAKKIVEEYEKASKTMIDALPNKWTDESLTEDIPMYGQVWKKGNVLRSLILHQVHHRGQITVLMRQAGLKVPGVYGPAKEEWAAMNMKPQQ